jgi:hypothetical protein
MRDKKYLMYYRMASYAFNVLVENFSPFLKFKCVHLRRPQLEVRKIVASVLYKFAHGLSLKHMSDIFDLGASLLYASMWTSCVMRFAIKTSFLTSTSRSQLETACCTSYNNLKTL